MLMHRRQRGNWDGQLSGISQICAGMPGGLRRTIKSRIMIYGIIEKLFISKIIKYEGF
jgi:hypothetical protein